MTKTQALKANKELDIRIQNISAAFERQIAARDEAQAEAERLLALKRELTQKQTNNLKSVDTGDAVTA